MSVTDPTAAIRTASDALSAAAAAIAETAAVCAEVTLRDPHGIWRSVAERPLASLLYAASPAGCAGGMGWAVRALDNTDPESAAEPGWRQVEHLCRRNFVLLTAAARVIDLDDRRRDSILLVLHDVIDYLTGGGATGCPSPRTV